MSEPKDPRGSTDGGSRGRGRGGDDLTGPLRAHHVADGQGERLTFEGTERHMKMTGADSSGQLTVYESWYLERKPHPLHIHHDAIESFYMLDGTCRFRVGDDIVTAGQGSFLSVPRGATHALLPGDCLRYQLFGPSRFQTPETSGARYMLFMV